MELKFELYQWNGFVRNGNGTINNFNKYYEHKFLNLFMTRKDLFEKLLIKSYINNEYKEYEFKHYIPNDSNIPHLCRENPIKYINELISYYNNKNE